MQTVADNYVLQACKGRNIVLRHVCRGAVCVLMGKEQRGRR